MTKVIYAFAERTRPIDTGGVPLQEPNLNGMDDLDPGTELLIAARADIIGIATLNADRTVRSKVGRLAEWLPAPGTDCCHCPLLVGMESELAELAEGKREPLALSGMRGILPETDHPVTAIVSWDEDRKHYLVIAMPDFAARQVEILVGSERRARRLMEQQLEAAASELRFASAARSRLRLARDLHDTLVHSLMAVLTQIRVVRHLHAKEPDHLSAGLATAEEAAISGLARARDAIARLRSPDGFEPMPDIERILSDFAGQTGTDVSVHIDADALEGLHAHEATVHRILTEALRNIEVHAQAEQVRFEAVKNGSADAERLVVTIRDDGRGFDTAVSKPGHFGLVGMAEFAQLAGGECRVESAPEKGTLVRLLLPTAEASVAQASSGHPAAGRSRP